MTYRSKQTPKPSRAHIAAVQRIERPMTRRVVGDPALNIEPPPSAEAGEPLRSTQSHDIEAAARLALERYHAQHGARS